MKNNIDIINKTKSKVPTLPWGSIKNKILGNNYELSLAFVSCKISKEINIERRNKNKPANILSFPLSKINGEIIMSPAEIKKQHKKYKMGLKRFYLYLFIHGLLHLSGLDHGSRMESKEKRFLKLFQNKK